MSKQIYMRFPGGRKKALTLSYDDGVRQDKRMMEILDRHGIKCTFNINTGCFGEDTPELTFGRMSRREASELYTGSGHEVAVHSLMHPHLELMNPNCVTYEVLQDRINLEKMFGHPIRGMAYPYGTYNDAVVECLRSCGIAYSRTTVSTEKFDLPTDWLRMPATCHHRNPRLMELGQAFLERNVVDNGKLFYLWGHTYEFDNAQNWNVIEEFAALMGGHEEIWYATNIEIYDCVQAYERLIWSADLSCVTNPSAQSVWFEINKVIYEIAPGETKQIG